jgi:lipopolysaccharide assembly outer membrane protein LptD (OstA)
MKRRSNFAAGMKRGSRKSIYYSGWLRLCLAVIALYFIATLTTGQVVQAQVRPIDTAFISKDSSRIAGQDSLAADSLRGRDSLSTAALEKRLGIRISKDELSSVVTATATDSAVVDLESNLFYLYGDADIKYEDVTLKAPQVEYNQKNNTISAEPASAVEGAIDTSARPSFTQGSETFTYDHLRYNFKTKRAIVRNARTQYGEGFVHSQQIKRNPDNSIFGSKSRYTTCNLDTPHFCILASRIKVIPGHIIVAGSANLMIEDVPTPLFLPFGVFPITETQRSGFRIPSYTLEQSRGLALTNGGYYFNISEYIDLLLLGSVYSKGSYNISALSSYTKRYQYNGGFSFNYAYNKQGEVYEPGASIQKQFAIQWRHSTDAKARPGQSFNSNVNIQKGNYYTDNSYNLNQIIQNQFMSNISYQRNWTGKPYSFTASALFNQNTGTRVANLTLPQMSFYVSQLTPLANNNRVGSARWYEKITLSYQANALAQTTFYDTAFNLGTLGLNDFNMGLHQSVPISAAYTIAKYINLSFGINYNEYWLGEQFYESFNTNTQRVDTTINRGFFTARDVNASMQLSTRIYGIKRWRRGSLAGIRHVLTPNVGLTYTPDFSAKPFNYYYQATRTANEAMRYFSPFARSPVGVPGLNQYGTFASNVNFGINNNLQIKTRSGSDTGATTKNVTLIDGLSINSAYNIAADSLGWSQVTMAFRTNILDKLSLNAGANFDPYVYDARQDRRTNVLAWNNGGFLTFQNAYLSMSSSFRSKQESGNKTVTQRTDELSRLMANGGYVDYLDFNVPWSLNISYNLSLTRQFRTLEKGGDTLLYNQTAMFGGDFNLTPRWKVTFNSGYDFSVNALTTTQIDIYRDLHCWEMRLGTIPFGPRKSYNFTINVKASVLQDLKLLRRRDYRDAVF